MCNLIVKTEDCHEFKANVYYSRSLSQQQQQQEEKKIIMVPEMMNDSFSGLNNVQKRYNSIQSI